MLFLSGAAVAQLGRRDNPLVGSVSGHTYTNEIFKISYTLPAEWSLQEWPSKAFGDATALLNAQTGPVQSPDASIALSADKISATDSLDASGYLNELEHPLKADLWEKAAPQGVPRGLGLLWTRRDFVSSSETSEFPNLAVLITPSHGYMLRLFCWGKTPSTLQAAVNTGEGLNLRPDWRDASDRDDVPPGKLARISSGVLAANSTRVVNPEYPQDAHKARVHGGVFLRVLVGSDGQVKRLYVLEGDPLLTQSAIDAVQQWRYKPYQLNGEPVEIVSVLWVEYK
jgi:TonB family protein